MAASARQAELNLVEPVERSDDNDGNIGKVAKTALKRLPSSVYWPGLTVWGFVPSTARRFNPTVASTDIMFNSRSTAGGDRSDRLGKQFQSDCNQELLKVPPTLSPKCQDENKQVQDAWNRHERERVGRSRQQQSPQQVRCVSYCLLVLLTVLRAPIFILYKNEAIGFISQDQASGYAAEH